MTSSSALASATAFIGDVEAALRRLDTAALERAAALLIQTHTERRTVYLLGNGGSSSSASHLACDLAKSAHVPGHPALRAISLTDNVALLTALANDIDYSRVFSEGLETFAEPGDLVIAISASGRSPNIVAGLDTAAAMGLRSIGLLGFDGGPALSRVDIALHVESDDYGIVESVHSAIAHALPMALKRHLQALPVPTAHNGHVRAAAGASAG
jgi:D-sedoheptulose 7-phosphate isomerase